MATWDGSYPVPDEPNYHPCVSQSTANSAHNTWNYYPVNGNNVYHQTTENYYPQHQPVMYEQNIPASQYQTIPDFSRTSANVMPPDVYQEHLLPSSSNMANNVQYYNNFVNPMPISTQPQYRNNYDRKFKSKENKAMHRKKSKNPEPNVSNSCLHATADEFVPDNIKIDKDRSNVSHKDVKQGDSSSTLSNNTRSQPKYSKTFFASNRNKQDKRYDNKRVISHSQRELSNDQRYESNVHKRSYHAQNRKGFAKAHRDNNSMSAQQADKPYEETPCPSSQEANSDVSTSESTVHGANYSLAELKENQQQTNMGFKEHVDNNDMKEEFQASASKELYAQFHESVPQKNHLDLTRPQDPQRNVRKKHESAYREKRNDYNDPSNYKNDQYKEDKAEKFYNRDRIKKRFGGQEKPVENWRQKENNSKKKDYIPRHAYSNKKSDIDDDASQRERLTEQLNKGQLECLVCCEYIRQVDYIWSCPNCYHVLHLKCVKKWAKSSQADNGWRCPACQNVNPVVPEDYYCFCGKLVSPEWNRRDTAHSCGEVCGRTRSKNNCRHKCTLLCHPGSCPVCIAMIVKHCGCGKMSQTLQCGTAKCLCCGQVCGKPLNCGRHTCEKDCHHGDCGPCEKLLTQECYCGKNTREVECQAETSPNYSCGGVCDKPLECQNHNCKKICHSEECDPCQLTPDKVTTCWCGQTPLTEKRESCLDPIITCNKICSKPLKCGPPSKPHTCKSPCHEGECPTCDLMTDVRCRCGNMDREIECKDLTTKADDARCERKCTKKRSCGKHKCNQMCCIDIEHICPLPCNKTLSCGRHKCEQTCHKGRCQPCWRSSFDELYCECGATVIYPPVPCGTRRPTCDKPCSREHSCGHEVLHNCHSNSVCPPCTVLTQKWCYGKHELRKAVPCHVNEISCGLPCNKSISCGRHKCITTCHTGPCERPGQHCVQPCTVPRELCGHICAAPCHDGPCPDIPCKEMVKVTCQCGHRSSTRVCEENSQEYQRIASSVLASKMADMQLGHLVNLEEVFGQGVKKQNQLKTLECNNECKIIERNRRLALGLQIANPDLSGKLKPNYSDHMKQWAKKDPAFCQMVHDKLAELVHLSKISKHKSRSYSFECMNKDKRHFVHEYCEHFGCESHAYDEEPKRNIVATAMKDKCWMPSYSLLEIVQRENGQRKVPGPMLNSTKTTTSIKTVLCLPSKNNQKTLPTGSTSLTSKSSEPEIDYFNYKG